MCDTFYNTKHLEKLQYVLLTCRDPPIFSPSSYRKYSVCLYWTPGITVEWATLSWCAVHQPIFFFLQRIMFIFHFAPKYVLVERRAVLVTFYINQSSITLLLKIFAKCSLLNVFQAFMPIKSAFKNMIKGRVEIFNHHILLLSLVSRNVSHRSHAHVHARAALWSSRKHCSTRSWRHYYYSTDSGQKLHREP